MQQIIYQTENFVKTTLHTDSTGHDFYHAFRVRDGALNIAKTEPGDKVVIELAALLHDISDYKFNGGDERKGGRVARAFLTDAGLDEYRVDRVVEVVNTVSFRGAHAESSHLVSEAKIVQDADRLDALGAIGIARCFAFGGHRGHPIYDPMVPVKMHSSFEEYKNHEGTSVNHFYEKLLLLKMRMNTPTGQAMAEKRHHFMQQFLDRFHTEWKGLV
ncbi:MAG: HD domain-containing protein [Deltaproteobacteria bacterium]|nr:HD domain-containing protein [Deltaproteobacteria bacterium]MBN2673009.1 HD domain-containing protein [Deltaproteobacteria bacterium]